MPNYFRSSTNGEGDKKASRLITEEIHSKFGDIFSAIGFYEGTLKLLVREGSQPYQTPPRMVAYVLQEPLKEELE